MGRLKTGRDEVTLLRLSKEGKQALIKLVKSSGTSSASAYADKLFRKLFEQRKSIVSSRPKDDID